MPNQTWGVVQQCFRGHWKRGVYLSDEFLVDSLVAVGAVEGLLEKGQQDRDDDDSLQRLSEDDEEDGHGEDLDRHDGGGSGGCVPGEGRRWRTEGAQRR